MSGRHVSDVKWVFSRVNALFPTFEETIAEHSLDYAAGKLGDAEQLCLRQRSAGLERGSDSFRLLVENRRRRLFGAVAYISPGNDALGFGFSPQHGFAEFDEGGAAEAL